MALFCINLPEAVILHFPLCWNPQIFMHAAALSHILVCIMLKSCTNHYIMRVIKCHMLGLMTKNCPAKWFKSSSCSVCSDQILGIWHTGGTIPMTLGRSSLCGLSPSPLCYKEAIWSHSYLTAKQIEGNSPILLDNALFATCNTTSMITLLRRMSQLEKPLVTTQQKKKRLSFAIK